MCRDCLGSTILTEFGLQMYGTSAVDFMPIICISFDVANGCWAPERYMRCGLGGRHIVRKFNLIPGELFAFGMYHGFVAIERLGRVPSWPDLSLTVLGSSVADMTSRELLNL